MNEKKYEFMILIQVQHVCNRIKNYLNITYQEARELLYNSKLYTALEDESTKMWYYSDYDLFRMFLEERETGKYSIGG